MKRFVQYGCGFTAPDEWINYDASPTLKFEKLPLIGKLYTRNKQRFPENVRFGDITKGLPEQPLSCDGIYCSHILEHLTYQDFQTALKNTYSILKNEGIFRCVVPDLKIAAKEYLDNFNQTEDPANHFMNNTMLGKKKKPSGIEIFKHLFGNSSHLWMWDEKTLTYELRQAGFKNIRAYNFDDPKDQMFELVEERDRFINAVSIECFK